MAWPFATALMMGGKSYPPPAVFKGASFVVTGANYTVPAGTTNGAVICFVAYDLSSYGPPSGFTSLAADSFAATYGYQNQISYVTGASAGTTYTCPSNYGEALFATYDRVTGVALKTTVDNAASQSTMTFAAVTPATNSRGFGVFTVDRDAVSNQATAASGWTKDYGNAYGFFDYSCFSIGTASYAGSAVFGGYDPTTSHYAEHGWMVEFT